MKQRRLPKGLRKKQEQSVKRCDKARREYRKLSQAIHWLMKCSNWPPKKEHKTDDTDGEDVSFE